MRLRLSMAVLGLLLGGAAAVGPPSEGWPLNARDTHGTCHSLEDIAPIKAFIVDDIDVVRSQGFQAGAQSHDASHRPRTEEMDLQRRTPPMR